MNFLLPASLTNGAILRNKEYAWELNAFPKALESAPSLGYACLGGQFWFLAQDDTVYEPFWLEANSGGRKADEPWTAFSKRSCDEVLAEFNRLIAQTDFVNEAICFSGIETVSESEFHSRFRLLFNAYFTNEEDYKALQLDSIKPAQ